MQLTSLRVQQCTLQLQPLGWNLECAIRYGIAAYWQGLIPGFPSSERNLAMRASVCICLIQVFVSGKGTSMLVLLHITKFAGGFGSRYSATHVHLSLFTKHHFQSTTHPSYSYPSTEKGHIGLRVCARIWLPTKEEIFAWLPTKEGSYDVVLVGNLTSTAFAKPP